MINIGAFQFPDDGPGCSDAVDLGRDANVTLTVSKIRPAIMAAGQQITEYRVQLGEAAAERLARERELHDRETVDGSTLFGLAVRIDPDLWAWDIQLVRLAPGVRP